MPVLQARNPGGHARAASDRALRLDVAGGSGGAAGRPPVHIGPILFFVARTPCWANQQPEIPGSHLDMNPELALVLSFLLSLVAAPAQAAGDFPQ
jgi:hypothetical protein